MLAKHVMIDVETMGTNPNAPVVQIGAAFFTREGVQVQSLLSINFEEALKYGKVDGSTIKFWLQQPKEAQNSLFQNERSMEEATDVFTKLLEAQNPDYFWAHATFDFPILQSLFASIDKKFPIPFWKMRDLRTLEMLADLPIDKSQFKGVPHNALHDAVFQAEHAIKCLNILERG